MPRVLIGIAVMPQVDGQSHSVLILFIRIDSRAEAAGANTVLNGGKG